MLIWGLAPGTYRDEVFPCPPPPQGMVMRTGWANYREAQDKNNSAVHGHSLRGVPRAVQHRRADMGRIQEGVLSATNARV
jgi:hypothetical protein